MHRTLQTCVITAITLFAIALPQLAVADEDVDHVQQLCNDMNTAYIAGDVDKLLDMSYPPPTTPEAREQRKATFKAFIGVLGNTVTSMTCGTPSQIVVIEGSDVALVPVTTASAVKGGSLVASAFYLAYSDNHRKNWRFTFIRPKVLATMFPSGLGGMTIPPEEPAKFIPN